MERDTIKDEMLKIVINLETAENERAGFENDIKTKWEEINKIAYKIEAEVYTDSQYTNEKTREIVSKQKKSQSIELSDLYKKLNELNNNLDLAKVRIKVYEEQLSAYKTAYRTVVL